MCRLIVLFAVVVCGGASYGGALRALCPVNTAILQPAESRLTTYRSGPIALSDNPFGDRRHRNAMAALFGRTLTAGYPVSGADYEMRASAFAERSDDWVATFETSRYPERATTIRVNLQTGRLLVVAPNGEVAIFLQLPVGRRAFGYFADMGDFFLELAHHVQLGSRSSWRLVPRLSAGEDIGEHQFLSSTVRRHFEKHVLGLLPHEGVVTARAGVRPHSSRHNEMPELRDAFLRELRALPDEDMEAWYRLEHEYIAQYANRAADFARATRSTILTLSRDAISPDGIPYVKSYRFDPVTNEFLIINRSRRAIFSYFIATRMDWSNQTLHTFELPDVETPTEFLLSHAALRPSD